MTALVKRKNKKGKQKKKNVTRFFHACDSAPHRPVNVQPLSGVAKMYSLTQPGLLWTVGLRKTARKACHYISLRVAIKVSVYLSFKNGAYKTLRGTREWPTLSPSLTLPFLYRRYLLLGTYFFMKHVDNVGTKRWACRVFRASRLHAVIAPLAQSETHNTKWNQLDRVYDSRATAWQSRVWDNWQFDIPRIWTNRVLISSWHHVNKTAGVTDCAGKHGKRHAGKSKALVLRIFRGCLGSLSDRQRTGDLVSKICVIVL